MSIWVCMSISLARLTAQTAGWFWTYYEVSLNTQNRGNDIGYTCKISLLLSNQVFLFFFIISFSLI